MIDKIKNNFLRRFLILIYIALSPAIIFIQFFCIVFMRGVPEAWNALKDIFEKRTLDDIAACWRGKKL